MDHILADSICELCKQPAYRHKQISWACPGVIGWLEGFYFTEKGLIPVTDEQKAFVDAMPRLNLKTLKGVQPDEPKITFDKPIVLRITE